MKNKMKNLILLWSLLIASFLLTGCSKKTISIGEMNIDFTNIQITDGTTGNHVALDQEQSQEFYMGIKDTKFVQGEAAKELIGWSYSIVFLKDEEVSQELHVNADDTMIYDGYIYKAKNPVFNLSYLDSIFHFTFEATVIGTDHGLLITPDQDSAEAKSSDKISVAIAETTVINDMEGNEISQEQLKVGDRIKITYNGTIAESYPAQITAFGIELIQENHLISGYISLIDTIYSMDSGLNNDISLIVIDTTKWVDITEDDKKIVLTTISEMYGKEVFDETYDGLVEAGLIDEEELTFIEGILIEITEMNNDKEKQTITCALKKWRSGIGAIGADAVAEFDGSEWTVETDNMWIS